MRRERFGVVVNMVEPRQGVAGSTERFDDLFRALYPRLFGLVYGLLGDRLETEDTLQEAFMKLADAPILQRPDEEVAAWMCRVALNLGANRLRGQRRAHERLERAGRLEMVEMAGDAAAPAQALLREEEQTEVRQALERLPDRQRDCLLLRHSGYSYAEIAATIGIAVGSVGVLLARAERAFRATYREHDHGDSSANLS